MNYFKTDGIRGIYPNEVNEELFKSVGRVLKILGQNTIVLGYDNRPSSLSLALSLLCGLNKSGFEVINFGLSSTPKLQFYSMKYKCLGAMITASHNEEHYNGLKLFINGKKITEAQEKIISNQVDFIDDYNNYLLKYNTPHNYKVAIDCANGATSKIITDFFCLSNYSIINNDISKEINKNCGALHPEGIKNYILKNKKDMGFALDGDGDRVVAVSKEGRIISGDYLLLLLALYYKKERKLKNNGVVLTKMSNIGIINKLKEENINVFIADVGDKHVLDEIINNDLVLGAEDSGHIIAYDVFPYGDGVLNILLIIQALNCLSITLDDLYNMVKPYYSILLNIKVTCFDFNIEKYKNVISYVRKSGTEDVIRIFLQSQNYDELMKCAQDVETYTIKNNKRQS